MIMYAYNIRCLCLVSILSDVLYLLFNVAYYGFRENAVFGCMFGVGVVESVVAGVYLVKVRNGQAERAQVDKVRGGVMCTSTFYSIYFVSALVLLLVFEPYQGSDLVR